MNTQPQTDDFNARWEAKMAKCHEVKHRVKLTSVQYSSLASQETACFRATVHLDGKRIAIVENDGRGGSDRWVPYAAGKHLDDLVDGETESGDVLVGILLDEWLIDRDLAKAMKSRVLMADLSGPVPVIYESNKLTAEQMPKALDHFIQKYSPVSGTPRTILNAIPLDKAREIYRKANRG